MPYNRQVRASEAAYLLEIQSEDEVVRILRSVSSADPETSAGQLNFLFRDVLSCALARVIEKVGVQWKKACSYAEAVLHTLIFSDEGATSVLEDETQELYCLVGDFQLVRIFLRSREDGKEVDVGAVKPILFPVTKTEINVTRALRPILYRARKQELVV